MDTLDMSPRSVAACILFTVMLGVYLNTLDDLPEPLVAPSYNIGQLGP